jgi:hypothetical protein
MHVRLPYTSMIVRGAQQLLNRGSDRHLMIPQPIVHPWMCLHVLLCLQSL